MRLPIRARLTLTFAGLLFVVLALSGALLLAGFHFWLDRSVRGEIQALAEEFAMDVADGETDVLEDFGVSEPAESFAQILNADGSIRETTREIKTPLIDAERIPKDLTPYTIDTRLVLDEEEPAAPSFLFALRTPQGPIVIVGSTLEENGRWLGVFGAFLLAAGGVLMVVVSGLAWLLSGAALAPVERMRKEVSLISATDLERRLAVPTTNDEIATLATTLNTMLARLADAFARERRFIDDASHELRTPLAILQTELQLALRRARTHEELVAALSSAAFESERLNQLAENLLILARLGRGHALLQKSNIDLVALAERVATRFRTKAGDCGVTIEVDAPAPLVVWVDGLRLEQALANLIANAIAFTPACGRIQIGVRRDNGEFVVSVCDTGPGFAAGFIDRAFEPFARTDTSRASGGDGVGLGLAIVREIAIAHGGSVTAENRPEGGACVTLRAPIGVGER